MRNSNMPLNGPMRNRLMMEGGGLSRESLLPPGMLDMAVRRNSPMMAQAESQSPSGVTMMDMFLRKIMEELLRKKRQEGQSAGNAPVAEPMPSEEPEQEERVWGQDAVENERRRRQMMEEL